MKCNFSIFFSFHPVVNQFYQTGSEDEYIIRGNAAILKCKIPSFIADFVFVETWLDSDGNEYRYHEDESRAGDCFAYSHFIRSLDIPNPELS